MKREVGRFSDSRFCRRATIMAVRPSIGQLQQGRSLPVGMPIAGQPGGWGHSVFVQQCLLCGMPGLEEDMCHFP